MQINVPVLEIGSVPIELVNKAATLCNNINWAEDRYTRDNDISLSTYSRLLPMKSKSASNPIYTEVEQELVNACTMIIHSLPNEFQNLTVINCEIATLPPDTLIKLHYDGKWSHKFSKRIHIPIMTNDKCDNTWLNIRLKMEPGKVYEINNRVLHGARNKGETNRTHLIIDFMEPEVFNLELSEGRSPWRVFDDDIKPLT
jgi:hypothetical protein